MTLSHALTKSEGIPVPNEHLSMCPPPRYNLRNFADTGIQ